MAKSNKLNLAITVNGKEVETTMTNLNKSFFKLRNSVNKLDEGTDEWIAANKELAKVEKERERQIKVQREFREELKKTIAAQEDSVDVMANFGENLSYAFLSLKNGDMVAFQSAWKGVTSNIKSAGKAALAFVSTPLGATIAALVAVAGVTKLWLDYNIAISKTIRLTQQLTGLEGQDLSRFRAEVQATADTFDKDFNDVLRSTNALSKQMKITQQEALEFIAQGFARGADASGDFLKKLEEYPVQFRNAGFTAQDFIDIATQEVKGGIYDDKLIDAIKEADLALKEMTATQIDALENAFGKKFAEDIASGMRTGATTTKAAINLIINKSNELGLNLQQKQQLVADVFKGAGEDAGGFEVILEQINLAFNEQNKQLNDAEESTLRLVEANQENEKAFADLFDASKSGFPAMLTNIKAVTTELYTGVLGTLRQITTDIRTLQGEKILEGQSNAMKRIAENMKAFGTTAKEESASQLNSAKNNVVRLKKKLEDVSVLNPFGAFDKKDKAQALAEAQGYLAELNQIAKGESEDFNKYLEALQNPPVINNDNPLTDEELKKRESELKKLASLEEKYKKIAEDREDKTQLEKIERQRQRALETAAELKASKDLIASINADYDAKRDEELDKQFKTEKERLKQVEADKQAILDELRVQKSESDFEKETIAEELKYEKAREKLEKELEDLRLTYEEKTELEALLKESHEERLLTIEKKFNAKKSAEQKKLYDQLIYAEENLQRAKSQALSSGINALQGFFDQSSGIYKALFLLERGLAVNEVIANSSKGIAVAQANFATVPAIIPGTIIPNPTYPVAFAAMTKNILATKLTAAAQIASIVGTTLQGFADGGETDPFRTGIIDQTGHEVAGIVHAGEYVVPKIVRQDPEVPQILNYLETKRKKKLGLFADGGDTLGSDTVGAPSPFDLPAEFYATMRRLVQKLEDPFTAEIYFGYEAENKRQEMQEKLDKIKSQTSVKN